MIPTKIATNAKTNAHILITASGNNRCGIYVRSREIGPPRTVKEISKTASMASDSKKLFNLILQYFLHQLQLHHESDTYESHY